MNSAKHVRHASTQIIIADTLKWAWAIGHGLGFKVGWAKENSGPLFVGLTNAHKKIYSNNFLFFFTEAREQTKAWLNLIGLGL